nr:hypothetical protein [Tanacetum cinerariifolium]
MATTIEQQTVLDESLVPSTQRNSPLFKAFQVTADVLEIYMQEFWATAKLYHNSIRFKIDIRKSVLDLEAFREMLHISPRIPNQPFADLPTEEEVLDFLRINIDFTYTIWEDFVYQVEHKSQKRSNEMNYPRFTKVIIDYFMTRKPSNSKAYQEYHACAMGEAAPKPKVSARKKKGDSASFTTPPTPTPITTAESAPRLSATAKGKQPLRATTPVEPTDVQRTEAEQLKLALKRSRQETHISQQSGSGTDKGTGSKPGVPDVPSDDSEEELSWNSSDDEDEELAKDDEEDKETSKGGDEVIESEGESEEEETREEEDENFDLIPRTPEESEEESNDEEEQELRLSEEARIQEEEDADELYRKKGRVMTLTLVNPDGQQQSSSVSSQFVTSMLNPSPNTGIDSLFESTYRVDVPVTTTVVPLLVPTPTLPPPSIPIISQVQQAPAPSPTTASSTSLQDFPNFGSLFGFDHRLKTLEANFSEFMQTNQFEEAVSSIPGIVDRYIDHRMNKVVKVAYSKDNVEV